jgi:hypothetical protein
MAGVALRLELGPALRLQKRISQAAFFTGLLIYLEAISALVLVTEDSLSPAAILPLVLVLLAQFVAIRRPVELLLRERLRQSYVRFLGLALVFVALLWLGSRGGESRVAAAGLGMVVVALTAWSPLAAIRAATRFRSQLRSVRDPGVLSACLSFDMRQAIAMKLRSSGGNRTRLAAPWLTASLALVVSLVALAGLVNVLGLRIAGGAIGQASGLVAIWVFYRTLRHAKLRASQLRARDTRHPVLLFRQFTDDALGTGRFRVGAGSSFEYALAAELDRIGPTLSIGKPGEKLPPLGASREYLATADWKTAVSTLIEEAEVAAFLLGDSESLLWEFRTTIASRGKERVLIIVPPLGDRAELRRRWARFVHATADVVGNVLPKELPAEPMLACFFAGDEAVMVIGHEPHRLRRLFRRSAPDYRMALRLFQRLLSERLTSAHAIETFLRTHVAIVVVSDDGEGRSREVT